MHPDYSSRSPGGDTLGRSLQPPSPADDNQEDADSGASDCLVPTAGGISPAARKRPLEPSAVAEAAAASRKPQKDKVHGNTESDNEDPRVPAAAICGNSNVLLRSRGDDDETPADPEDDPVPETPFVPDVGDLSEPLRLPDRETSRRSVADDLPCLSAPPGGDFRTRAVFSFGLDDADGGGPEDGLDSPTLLTL